MATQKKVPGVEIENKLSFKSDISGLQAARSALEDIQKKSFLELQIIDYSSAKGVEEAAKKLDAAKESASQLSSMLDAAFNKDLGKLNISAFEQQLKQSNTSLQQIYTNLSAIGPIGQDAFHKVATEVLTTSTQLQKSKTFLDDMAETMSNTIKWGIASSTMKNFTTSVQQAYNYVKDLDHSLNEIRIVSGLSADQMDRFAIKANASAKALGAATKQYTDASLIYFQQGLDMEEATQRTDVTIKMSNVLGESASKVSDYMTAIWNNFDDGSQSLEYFGDVLAKLGASTASSAEEIAEGLDKFAAVSNTVGLSYEYATTALATVVAETRQSADVVGTAFKTLFARIQDLELGKTLDDDTTLGTYSQALDAVGINIKQQNGELKDMDDILDEMGTKWKTLNKDQQVALAQTVAGVRQYTQLIALMDNWDTFNKNLKIAQTSTGTLNKQQATYMESIDAHTQQLRTSWEELYSALGDNKVINSLLDDLIHIVELLNNFIDSVGGGAGVLKLLGSVGLRVFDKQLSGGIARLIKNFNRAKDAAKELDAQAQVFNEFKMIDDGSDAYKNLISMVEQRIKYQDLISKKELEDINNIIKAKAEQDRLLESIENTAKAAEKFKELSGERARLGSANGIRAEKGRLLGKVEAAGLNAPAKEKQEERESIIDAVDEVSRKFDVDSNYKISGDESARTAMQRFWESYGDQQKASEKLLPLKEALGENSEEFQNLSALIDKARISLSQFVNQSGSVVEDSSKLKEYESTWDAVYDAVDQLKNNIGDAKAIINQSADAIVDNLSNEQNKLKDVATSASQKLGADYSNIINEKETQRKAQNIADLTSGIMSLSMAITQVQNLGSIWDNDDLTFSEKLLQTVISLGIAFGQLSSAIKQIKKAIPDSWSGVKEGFKNFSQKVKDKKDDYLEKKKDKKIKKSVSQMSQEEKDEKFKEIKLSDQEKRRNLNQYKTIVAKRHGLTKEASYEDVIDKLKEDKHSNLINLNKAKAQVARGNQLSPEKQVEWQEKLNKALEEQAKIEKELVELEEKKNNAAGAERRLKDTRAGNEDAVIEDAATENEEILDTLIGGEINSERLSKFTEKFHELGGGIKGVVGGLESFIGPQGAVMLAVGSITWAVNRVKQYYADLKEQADETSSQRNEEAEQARELTQANKDNAKSYIELEQAKATMDYDEYTKQHAELVTSLGTEAAKLDVLINKYKQYGQSAEDAQNTALKVYSAQQAQSTKQKDVTAGRAATYAIGQDVREKRNISYDDGAGTLSVSEWGNKNNPLLKAIGQIDGISDPEDIKFPSDPEKFVKMVNAMEDAYSKYGETALNDFSDGYAEKIREALNAIESSDSWANAQSAATDIEIQNMDIAAANEATGWTATGAQSFSQAKKNYDKYRKNLQDQGYSSEEADKMAQQYFSQSGITSYDQEMANYQTTLEKVALSGTKSYYYADQLGEDQKQEWWSKETGEKVKKIVSEAYANNMQDLFDVLSNSEKEALISGKENLTNLWNKYNNKLTEEYWKSTGKAITEAGDDLANKLASRDIDASEILNDESYKKLIDEKSSIIKYSGDSSNEISNLYDILENTALAGTDQFRHATERVTDIAYQKTLDEGQAELSKLQNELKIKLGDDLEEAKKKVIKKSNEIAAIEQTHLNNLKKRMSSISSELDNIQSSYSSLKDVVKDYNSDGKITLDNLQSLLTMSDDYLACLEMQNGQLAINKNKMIDLVKARIDDAEANAYNQLITQLGILAQQDYGDATVDTAKKVTVLTTAMREGIDAAKESEAAFSSWASSVLSSSEELSKLDPNDERVKNLFQSFKNKINPLEDFKNNLDTDFDSLLSGGTDSQANMKEYQVDRYEKIDRIINKITRDLEKLQNQQEKLIGADLLSNLNQQNELLNAQVAAYEKKLELQKQEANQLRGQLGSYGATFDEDGNINYNDFMIKITNAANSGLLSDEQYDRYKEQADNYKTLWEESLKDTEDQIEEFKNKLQEIELQRLNVKVDMQLDTSEFERTFNEWYNKIVQGAQRAYSTQLNKLNADLAKANAKTFQTDIGALSKNLADKAGMYQKLLSGDQSIDQSSLLEDLKNYIEKLQESMTNYEEAITSAHDAYISAIDEWDTKVQNVVNDYEAISNELNHAISLTKLLFGDNSYNIQNQYLDKVIEANNKKLVYQRQQVEKYKELMDEALKSGDEEVYAKYQENYKSWLSSLQSSLEFSLQNIKDKFTNTINQIFVDMDNNTFGRGLQEVEDDWERATKAASQYLDKIESTYQVSKLIAKYTKQINSTTDLSIQNKLTKAMEAQRKALEEKNKLSKYDLDLANARYELLVAQIALEEAQANKTSMRLKRDSQGNYSYVYAEDEDKVSDAQSQADDARNNIWSIIKSNYSSLISEGQSQYKGLQDALKNAYQEVDEETRNRMIESITTQYQEIFGNLGTLFSTSQQDIISFIAEERGISTADVTDDMIKEYLPTWGEDFSKMIESLGNVESFQEIANELNQQASEARDIYDEAVQEALSLMNESLETIRAGIYGEDDSTILADILSHNQELIDKAAESVEYTKDIYEQLIQGYEDFSSQYDQAIEQITGAKDIIEELNEKTQKYQESADENIKEINNKLKNTYEKIANSAVTLNDIYKRLGSVLNALSTNEEDSSYLGYKAPLSSKEIKDRNLNEDIGKMIGQFPYHTGTTKDPIPKPTPDKSYIINPSVGIVGDKTQIVPDNSVVISGRKNSNSSDTEDLLKVLNKGVLFGYDTGGYTGSWNDGSGKLAFLHSKELVLNKEDTNNILSAVDIVREIPELLSLLKNTALNKINDNLYGLDKNNYMNSSVDNSNNISQNVTIDANFPSVQSATEIEDALNNLVNKASQYAYSN